VAAGIRGARFVTAPGEGVMLFVGGEAGTSMRLLTEFMGAPAPDLVTTAHAEGDAAPSGTAVILFADIVDSTATTETLGDAAFRERARQLDERLRAAIRAASGTPVEGKLLGDGVLAVFSSARQAIDAALHCAAAGGEFGLQLHLGVHAGDVIREGDNVFGGAVNIASRISGLSAPDEVLVSATVRDLARTSAGVTFDDRGEHALKGVGEAVRVFAVRMREA
jgi:class 3 adenylate cyclase